MQMAAAGCRIESPSTLPWSPIRTMKGEIMAQHAPSSQVRPSTRISHARHPHRPRSFSRCLPAGRHGTGTLRICLTMWTCQSCGQPRSSGGCYAAQIWDGRWPLWLWTHVPPLSVWPSAPHRPRLASGMMPAHTLRMLLRVAIALRSRAPLPIRCVKERKRDGKEKLNIFPCSFFNIPAQSRLLPTGLGSR